MGNVMISIDDEKEQVLRKYAQELYGGKKGSLSEFVWAAIAEYVSNVKKEYERKQAIERMFGRMRNAKKLGILNKEGVAYLNRDEIYGERMAKAHRH